MADTTILGIQRRILAMLFIQRYKPTTTNTN